MTISDNAKHIVDAGALTTTTLAFIQVIPNITALLSLIWVLIRIYETKTVQKCLSKRQKKIIKDEVNE